MDNWVVIIIFMWFFFLTDYLQFSWIGGVLCVHGSGVCVCCVAGWCSAGKPWSSSWKAAASATAMTLRMTWCWECASMPSDFPSPTVRCSIRLVSHSLTILCVSLCVCICEIPWFKKKRKEKALEHFPGVCSVEVLQGEGSRPRSHPRANLESPINLCVFLGSSQEGFISPGGGTVLTPDRQPSFIFMFYSCAFITVTCQNAAVSHPNETTAQWASCQSNLIYNPPPHSRGELLSRCAGPFNKTLVFHWVDKQLNNPNWKSPRQFKTHMHDSGAFPYLLENTNFPDFTCSPQQPLVTPSKYKLLYSIFPFRPAQRTTPGTS